MRDYVRAVRACHFAYRKGRGRYEGEFYSVRQPLFSPGADDPWPDVPIYVAGVNPVMTAVAGEVADGFAAHMFSTSRYLDDVLRPALARGAARASRTAPPVMLPLVVGRDRASLAAYMTVYCVPSYRRVLDASGLTAEMDAILAAIADRRRTRDNARRPPGRVRALVGARGPARTQRALVRDGSRGTGRVVPRRRPDPRPDLTRPDRLKSAAGRRSQTTMAAKKPIRKATKRSTPGATARGTKIKGLTAEEKAAMKETIEDQKAAARGLEGKDALLAKIAAMREPDRGMAKRIHAIVTANAPALSPTTWYGMPAWAKGGKAVLFFQDAAKFKARYATLGFNDSASLDDGTMWPISFALKEWTPAMEARIGALVKKAAG